MATLEETLTLSAPKVQVNGRTIKIIPGSVERDIPGERKVRAVSAGGNTVSMVSGLNVEELKASVKFSVPHTAEMVDWAEAIADDANRGVFCTIKIIEQTKQLSYEQMILTAKPSTKYEAEGSIDLEFEGRYVP